uniref:Uncharacterized protein n=1 Tax=Arundo donax TaxID=35708 RepID=A0A0A9FEJ9_ARUDO
MTNRTMEKSPRRVSNGARNIIQSRMAATAVQHRWFCGIVDPPESGRVSWVARCFSSSGRNLRHQGLTRCPKSTR